MRSVIIEWLIGLCAHSDSRRGLLMGGRRLSDNSLRFCHRRRAPLYLLALLPLEPDRPPLRGLLLRRAHLYQEWSDSIWHLGP